MIGKLHIHFAKHILSKCGLSEDYAMWSTLSDGDILNYHRYSLHKISNFNTLYTYGIQKYDMRKALNNDIAYFMYVSHLYLDMLNGPLKIFDGINITSHRRLHKLFNNLGYVKTINKIYNNIHNPSEEYVNSMCSLIDSLEITDKSVIFTVMINRLLEETIGNTNLNELSFPEVLKESYKNNYNEFIRFEEKAFLYLRYL